MLPEHQTLQLLDRREKPGSIAAEAESGVRSLGVLGYPVAQPRDAIPEVAGAPLVEVFEVVRADASGLAAEVADVALHVLPASLAPDRQVHVPSCPLAA